MQRAETADRHAIHEELERVRADFHRLLESASARDLARG